MAEESSPVQASVSQARGRQRDEPEQALAGSLVAGRSCRPVLSSKGFV